MEVLVNDFRKHKTGHSLKDKLNPLSSCGIRAETSTHYFLINYFGNIYRFLATSSNMNHNYYLVMINLMSKNCTLLICTIICTNMYYINITICTILTTVKDSPRSVNNFVLFKNIFNLHFQYFYPPSPFFIKYFSLAYLITIMLFCYYYLSKFILFLVYIKFRRERLYMYLY